MLPKWWPSLAEEDIAERWRKSRGEEFVDGRLKLYQAGHMWLCALTLVPSEMDILHFLHQKDFHQNSSFSKPTKTSPKQNNSLLNIFQSYLFLCSPWVIFLLPTASHRARGAGGGQVSTCEGDSCASYCRAWGCEHLRGWSCCQPQLVSTKSWRLQIVDVRKSLKLLDVIFFFETTNFIKSFVFL